MSEEAPPGRSALPILVVESDRYLGQAITDQLLADGFAVQLARTAQHARILASAVTPRLAVLGSLDSPLGAVGRLQEIRARECGHELWGSALPVIVLSRSPRTLDVLRAFEAGADDFLTQPGYLELRARIRAILRRSEGWTGRPSQLTVEALTIDAHAHAVRLHGEVVELRRMEFQLLLHLAGEPHRVFTKDELLRAVWGYRSGGSTRTLDSHASRLRRKLDDGERRWVVNVWGVGYRLT